MQNITTLQDAEQYAAQHGITITERERRQIAGAQRAELERLQELESVASADRRGFAGLVASFNRFYPQFLESLVRVAEIMLTFAQTLIVSFGVPAVLVLLLIVEHQRVYHGIALFEVDGALASFAAAALVVANLTLEFTIHYVESKAGYQPDRAARWSLRLWARNAAYTLGIGGKKWSERQLSPAQRYRALLRLVTMTILALALAGSMRSVIESTSGAWHEALIAVLTRSSLSEMSTWLSGLLFALAAVLTAQGLSRYVALRTAEIVAGMGEAADQPDPAERYAPQLESAGAAVVMAIVSAKLEAKAAKQRAKDEPTAAKPPFGSPALALADDDDTQPIEPQPGQNGRADFDSAAGNVTK